MKKVLVGVLVGIAGMGLMGCGSTIPEMTKEQQELVVEYAAGEVLKFDKNHTFKLTDLEEAEEEAKEEQATAEAVPAENGEDEEDAPDKQEGILPDDVTVIDKEQENVSIEQFLGLDDIQITYTGFEVADSYPSDSDEEVYFYMDATQNRKLLVLKFDLKNTSAGEKDVDLAASQVRYKIIVDGLAQNALTTLLLNDMAYFQGTLAAGESAEVVVVGEVALEQADQVEALELVMKSVDDTATISLN